MTTYTSAIYPPPSAGLPGLAVVFTDGLHVFTARPVQSAEEGARLNAAIISGLRHLIIEEEGDA